MPFGLGFGEWVVLMVPIFLLLVPAWRIVTKAGYSGFWSLLIFIPLVNVIALFAFAFSEWPLERNARASVPPS